ncbi:MAG: hypothetical protein IAE79_13435 [Anaerolinea sp.]|nr:hypothetical protein [Anaerolinea sp.]
MSIEKWIKEFQASPTVKALKTAYSTFSYLNGAYEVWTSIFFPEPSAAELIIQAKEEIIREIRETVSDHWIARVGALIKTYEDYVILQDPDKLDYLLPETRDAIEHLESIIVNKDPRSAYLVAEAYNIVVPLACTTMLQDAAHQKDSGVDIDWVAVQERNQRVFKRAIEINQVLLGRYVFDELPNIPCYRLYHGKLNRHFREGNVNREEYIRKTEYVWQANENLRENTFPGIKDTWFSVESALDNQCLHASETNGSVSGVFRLGQSHENVLWKLHYYRYDSTKIEHWSGKCLTIDDLELSERNRPVQILPCSDKHKGQYWNIGHIFHSLASSSVSVTSNYNFRPPNEDDSYVYKKTIGLGDGTVVAGSNAYVPTNSQNLICKTSDPFYAELIPVSGGFAFQNRAPGSENSYEVFLREGDHIQHYWRSWKDGRWRKGGQFGEDVRSAPAAFQNWSPGSRYNYELFVHEGNHIQHYWRSWKDGRWRKGGQFGENIRSAPSAFQNWLRRWEEFDYEVFVREGSNIQHYRWDQGKWYKMETLGSNAVSAPAVDTWPDER